MKWREVGGLPNKPNGRWCFCLGSATGVVTSIQMPCQYFLLDVRLFGHT